MPRSSTTPIHVLFSQDGEPWSVLGRRLKETDGQLLLILSGRESELIAHPDIRKIFLKDCASVRDRLRLATKHPAVAAEARSLGIRVLDRTRHVRALLSGHPKMNDALRVFSPQLWRQQLTSRMQRMGLLSVPKLRIFSLAALSLLLFYVVVFRLLPSADITVKPRQESVSQTVNVYLVQSGANLSDISNSVRRMRLIPVEMNLDREMAFDHVSKEFIGTTARTQMTVVNESDEAYELRTGTRFMNQAGMIFRILDPAIVEAGGEVTVRAQAEDLDLYGEIIGERGNVPAGLKWDIPGLAPEERSLVYGENRIAATGGTTSYRTVLQEQDLELARKKLEQDLLTEAMQNVEGWRRKYNEEHPDQYVELLNAALYEELTETVYHDFVLPLEMVGQEVSSVPVRGSITYRVYGYDAEAILQELRRELAAHVREGRKLVQRQLMRENLDARPIQWDDGFRWIKLTVELAGVEEYVLDPLTSEGAVFAKKVRELVAGMDRESALRVLRNLPEVERVDISQWPPWNGTLPRIPSHISVLTEQQ